MIPASGSISCSPDEKLAAMLKPGDEVDSFSCGGLIKMKVMATSNASCSSWITLHTQDGPTKLCYNSMVLVPLDGKLIERKAEDVTVGTKLMRLSEGMVLISKVCAVSREFMSPEPAVSIKAKMRRMFIGGILCKV